MKYYIIKPKSHKVNEDMIKGIKHTDNKASFVSDLNNADICVLQKGWTRSKLSVEEYKQAVSNYKRCCEGYIYTDWIKVELNNENSLADYKNSEIYKESEIIFKKISYPEALNYIKANNKENAGKYLGMKEEFDNVFCVFTNGTYIYFTRYNILFWGKGAIYSLPLFRLS